MNLNPYLALSQEDPSAFLRLALQATLASGAREVKIEANSHQLNLPWIPDASLKWELEQVKARLESGLQQGGLETALEKVVSACALTACRPDLRVNLSVPGGSRSLEVDEQGVRWGSADSGGTACRLAFSRYGERPDAKPRNALLDFFSAPLSGPWPELFNLGELLFDAPAPISVNGTALGKLTLDPPEELTPESIELFRLAVVHPHHQLNNLGVIAQTRTLIHSRSVIEAVLHPLVFACVTPEGEPLPIQPGSTVPAWAALSLHAEPLQLLVSDSPGSRHNHWEPDHILRIVQYGISIARTRSGVSPKTRVVMDGSDLETDIGGQRLLDETKVKEKCVQVKSLYELACRVWGRELDHHSGLENVRLGLHNKVLKEFEATLPALTQSD